MGIRAVPVLLVLLCASSVNGLFEEQAQRYTWHQQYIGKVKLARTASKPASPLFVATEKNVIAALASKDGSIVWRKVFVESDSISHLEVAGDRVVVLSGSGKHLRVFEADSGRMLWQATLGGAPAVFGLPPPVDLAVTRSDDQSAQIVVALGATIQAFNAANGKALWSQELPVEGVPSPVRLQGGAANSQGLVWAAAVQQSQQELVLVQLSAATGERLQHSSIPAPAKLSQEHLVLTPEAVVVLSDAGSTLCTCSLAGSSGVGCQSLDSLLPEEVSSSFPALIDLGSSSLDGWRCPAHVVVRVAGGTAILRVQSGAASLVKFVAGTDASGCLDVPSKGPLVALTYPGIEEQNTLFTVEVVSATDGSTVQKYEVPQLTMQLVGGQGLEADRAWLVPITQRAGKVAIRPLVVMEEHTLALLPTLDQKLPATASRPGASLPEVSPQWSRPEALAGVLDALLVELPAPTPEHEAAWQAAQPGLGEAIKAQLLALKAQVVSPTPEEAAELASYRAATNDKLRPTRDPDGFRKQVVVTTEAGKVAALHNGDGRVLWALEFGPTAPRKLVDWVTYPNLEDGMEVAVLHPDKDAVASVQTDTGSLWTVQTMYAESNPVADVVPLPFTVKVHPGDTYAEFNAGATPDVEAAAQHVYAMIPENPLEGLIQVLPDSIPASEALKAAAANFSFWRVDKEEGVVRGYGVSEDGRAEERWTVAVAPPGSGLVVLEVASHESREEVQSHAKVLGDGSLKFKYLNPNTVLVAVGPPPPVEGQQQDFDEPSLTVFLIDGVTGRVLASHSHEGARGPVHAVLCEHWAVYHYWDAVQHRWQMSVLELYDASHHDLRVLDLAFSESTANVSSWDATPLEVLYDSYFTKIPVSRLSVTRTARGVTARQILMATPTGRVYMMDKRLLDPRRPRLAQGAKPTPQMQAEGLVPYQEELPYSTVMYATGDKQVKNLRGVVTCPAAMESTTLVFVHGLDLFYTRLSPSKAFDLLPDDFPFALLILIVVGMTVASAALSILNRRTALKKKWE